MEYNLSWPIGTPHGTNTLKLDANESAFFKRQIEYIKAKTYDVKYKDLKAFTLIPISNESPSGATEITWRQFAGVGFAKIISDYANDFPRVDVYGVETTTKVRGIGASYGYSVVEIRRAQMANIPLDQKKANMTRRAIEQVINQLAHMLRCLTHPIQIGFCCVVEYILIVFQQGQAETVNTPKR